ncbi:MAG TPA: hypothetical protein ENI05_11425 [Porticoccus sp.]|nr:hypothetical protein [Porticoccus sp.]
MQHLNLYSQLGRAVEPLFSGRQQTWALSVVFILMLFIYGVLWFGVGPLQETQVDLERQQQTITAQLNKLKARKAKLEQDDSLEKEIAVLSDDIKFRRQLLASIDPTTDPGNTVMEKGFADHLKGLARQSIKGMWFTEIQLQNGGQQLALMGRTRAPEYVPRYLQKLTAENIFSGRQFKVFRMSIPEDENNIMIFELRSAEAVSDDASARSN